MSMPGFVAEESLYTAQNRGMVTILEREHAGQVVPAQYSLPTRGPGCMRRCLAENQDDDYAWENCHCICFGHPGHTCWLQ